MATSGTVATFNFTVRKFVDMAARRAGRIPEKLGSEDLSVAVDLLNLQLAEYVSAGFPLWTRQYILLGATMGSPDVPTPAGTVDVLHAYWRIFNPYRGGATLSNGNDGSVLFGGAPNADVTIPGPNPAVKVSFGTPIEVDTVGVLLGGGAPVTTAVQIQTSPNGLAPWTTVQTLPSATYQPMAWTYFDLNPVVTSPYIQVLFPISGSIALNQLNFGLANYSDIAIGPLNIDSYYNLPDKQFSGQQPNSAYDDRQINGPVLKIWPVLNATGFYNGAVTALVRRYIQDVGSLSNTLEIPVRWYEGVLARLAVRLIDSLSDQEATSQTSIFQLQAKQQRRTNLEASATKAEALFWAEERDKSPIQIAPNISPYTR